MYDIIIVGAGPAGLTAAVYARRADKSVLIIERGTFGGQITFSPKIENFPSFSQISGNDLAERMVDHAINMGAEIEMAEVTGIEQKNGVFYVSCDDGQYLSKTVILATGSKHRRLGLDREEEFIGNGISFCAVCDGAFYSEKCVAVIGGGNSALVEATMLSDSCAKVYIVQNLDYLTGEEKLISALKKRDNVEFILGTVVDSIYAEDEFGGIIIRKLASGEKERLDVDGIFVAIGQEPENQKFSNLISLSERGYAVADESCTTETQGMFVAGDCRTKNIRQITTACSDGAIAALAACRFIDDKA